MGNANVVTRDNSPLPVQAAAVFAEMPVVKTHGYHEETPIETVQESTNAIHAPATLSTEMLEISTFDQISAIALTPTVFEMTSQPAVFEMAMQPTAVVQPNEMPSAVKLENTFAYDGHFYHNHWDDNWYALLAELHVQEQHKKDKWHEQNDGDDWLAEFEKLALLDLRK